MLAVDGVLRATAIEEEGASSFLYDDLAAAASQLREAILTDKIRTSSTASDALQFVQQEQQTRAAELMAEGQMQEKNNNFKEALAAYEAAAEIMPQNEAAQQLAATARQTRQTLLDTQQRKAIERFHAAVRRWPSLVLSC